jgi:sugar lactone lactonase YvrE
MVPMQAVPTTVTTGPDGALYVGQLTGFPFPQGGARVYRVPAAGGTPDIYADGFTNIIDIAFGPDGSLYLHEIYANGLLSGDETGALIRVAKDGTKTTIASEGLVTPGGVAVGPDGALYVTNHSISPGGGEVLKIVP